MNRHLRLHGLPDSSEQARSTLRVIFDVESLMVDPTPGIRHCLRLTARDFGVEVPERWFRGCWSSRMPFHDALGHVLKTDDPQRIEEGCLRYHQHFSEDGRFRGNLRPGAVQLFAALASDADIELNYLTHIGLSAAVRLLDTYGVAHLPRNIVTPEEAHCPGVRLPLIEHLTTRNDSDSRPWILLSDHPFELSFARRLGKLRTIGIGYARLSMEMLQSLQPDAIAEHPGEIVALLHPDAGATDFRHESVLTIH